MNTQRIAETIDPEYISRMVYARYAGAVPNDAETRAFLDLTEELIVSPELFEAAHFQPFHTQTILNYLEKGHRYYLNKKLPELELSIHNLIRFVGEQSPLTNILLVFYKEYKTHLVEHIKREDDYVFPYVHQLLKRAESGAVVRPGTMLNGWSSLASFLQAHTDTETELREVREIIRAYAAKESMSHPYELLLTQLSLLEADLHVHALIEDEVLLPRALELESVY
jgi:regulator of cell morphogenesis and NO signaling